jgi:hypothetical protein
MDSGSTQLLHPLIVNVSSSRLMVSNGDSGASIGDEIADPVVFVHLDNSIQNYFHRCL